MFNTRTTPQSYTPNQHGRQSHIEVSKGTVFTLDFILRATFFLLGYFSEQNTVLNAKLFSQD